MSDTPASGGSIGSAGADEQFTVPVPAVPPAPGAGAGGPSTPAAVAPTQAIPVFERTRELPTADPSWPGPTGVSTSATTGVSTSAATGGSTSSATGASAPMASSTSLAAPVPPNPYAGQPVWPPTADRTADESVDPLLGQIGFALFWITVGWWLFFLIRLLGHLMREGVTDTMVIQTIDHGAEETVVVAVLSVLAALLLLLGRGRAGRSPLGWASLALAVVTVAVAVWRVLP